MWGIAGVWADVNNDGLLDLFVVNYLQWDYATEPLCEYKGVTDYCGPRSYKGLPNVLYLNKGDGTFEDVTAKWGLRASVGKGMGGSMADYDLDGLPDLFVTNDGLYNFLFHNKGGKFEEVAFPAGVALAEDGNFISGMGNDFRDFDNDGYPDIAFVALERQTFPLFKNMGGKDFREVTRESGMRSASMSKAGFGAAPLRLRQRRLEGPVRQSRRRARPADAQHHHRSAQHRVPQSGFVREVGGADGRSRTGRGPACPPSGSGLRRPRWRWPDRRGDDARSPLPPRSG